MYVVQHIIGVNSDGEVTGSEQSIRYTPFEELAIKKFWSYVDLGMRPLAAWEWTVESLAERHRERFKNVGGDEAMHYVSSRLDDRLYTHLVGEPVLADTVENNTNNVKEA